MNPATCRKSWPGNLFQVLNWTFDPCFKVKWGHHIKTSLFLPFYPTALKGCQGIVFIHGVRMGGRREIVCPGCISETVRCRKLILGRDIG